MAEELTFLQEIIRAYQSCDSSKSLTAFFNQMNDLMKPDNPFVLFMSQCLARRDTMERLGVVQNVLSADRCQSLNQDKTRISDNTFQFLLDTINAEIDYSDEIKSFEIQIFYNNELKNQITLSHDSNFHLIPNVVPGVYSIKLSTGRILWEKQITLTHVLRTPSEGQTELKLAAKTTRDERRPTFEDVVMGKFQIRVFAGINNGTMEVEL